MHDERDLSRIVKDIDGAMLASGGIAKIKKANLKRMKPVAGKPRLLGVDNPIYVPVNKVIEIETTGADVIHSWALPQMGVKMDAVPGRLNHTWFKAEKVGI